MGFKSFEYFIASKLSEQKSGSFIAKIIRIAQIVIGLCLAVMLIGGSIIQGFKHDITEKVFGFWGHIHIMDARMNINADQVPFNKNQNFYPAIENEGPITFLDYRYDPPKRTKTKGGVRKIQSYALLPGIIDQKNTLEGIIFKGIDQDYDWDFLKNYIKSGTILDLSTADANREMLISVQTAKRLNLDVKDKVIVHFIVNGQQYKRRFTIKGIYKTGLEEFDKKYAIIHISIIRDLLQWTDDQIGGFELILDDLDDLERYNEYLYAEQLPPNLFSETLRQKAPQIFEWIEMQNINEIVLLILMGLVALINMVTVMMIIILERTTMIGTLKALGAKNWSIRQIFLFKAGRIIALSLLIGNLLALSLCLIQKYTKLAKLKEADYYISYVPVKIDPLWWFFVNFVIVLVILIFMLIPSYIVSKIDPVKALRFK